MHKKPAMLARAVIVALMLSPIAWAQQGDSGSDAAELQQIRNDLKKDIDGLRQEIANLRKELKGLRGDLSRAVSAMRTAKKPSRPRQRPAETLVGKPAPEFAVTTKDGEKTKIGGKRDKPQVVFCYASWCGFCKRALPWIEKLHQKYKDKGIEVLALNLDARGQGGRARTEEQTLEHYDSLNLTMPMTMTTDTNDTKKIGAALKARSFPTLFVVGKTGTIESVHVGAKPNLDRIVGNELDVLLAGKTRADFPK